MRNKKTLLLIMGFTALVMACACRVNHNMGGEVETENKVTARVEVDYPICAAHPEWTYEQIIKCIEVCSQYTIKIESDEELQELLGQVASEEQVISPENILGGI